MKHSFLLTFKNWKSGMQLLLLLEFLYRGQNFLFYFPLPRFLYSLSLGDMPLMPLAGHASGSYLQDLYGLMHIICYYIIIHGLYNYYFLIKQFDELTELIFTLIC